MRRTTIAAAALTALLAAGAQAQTTEPAPDPTVQPVAPAPADPAADAPLAAPAGDWTMVDIASLSADRLIGADIVNPDGEKVAAVDDVILGGDGTIESVVARFGGVLGFGASRVLLAPDEVDFAETADARLVVRTSLSPEAIADRPEHQS
jgi:hypothetical protein